MDDLAFVETDVQLTRDGVPVLFHDTTLERITGDSRSVGDLDHRRRPPPRCGRLVRPPNSRASASRRSTSSSIALAERETRPRARRAQGRLAADEVRTVLDLIERHGLRGRVVLQSFSLETLFAVQRVSPTTPRIMLIRELPADPVPLAERLGVIGFGTTAESVTAVPDALDALHEIGIAVLCYTLNSHERWQEVSELGVDGIITDQPSELDAWLAVTAPGT